MFQAATDRIRKAAVYWGGIVAAAGSNWLQSQAFIFAAALAFFTVFSIAPVIIVAVAVAGVVLGERAARGQLLEQLQHVLGPEAAEAVETAVANSRIEQAGLWPTVIGLIAIMIGATTVFAQMQRSLNTIWDVVPRPSKSGIWRFIRARLLSLTIVLAVGFILLVSLLVSVAMRAVIIYAEEWMVVPEWGMVTIEVTLSLAVITALFAAIFRILPDVVLSWRDVLLGALITALLFTLGRSLIAIYLAQTATASAYGAAGSLAVLLIWVNFSSWILLFGAAFTRAHLEARGGRIRPRSISVRVHHELIEDSEPPADA